MQSRNKKQILRSKFLLKKIKDKKVRSKFLIKVRVSRVMFVFEVMHFDWLINPGKIPLTRTNTKPPGNWSRLYDDKALQRTATAVFGVCPKWSGHVRPSLIHPKIESHDNTIYHMTEPVFEMRTCFATA